MKKKKYQPGMLERLEQSKKDKPWTSKIVYPRPVPGKDQWEVAPGKYITGTDYAAGSSWQETNPNEFEYKPKPGGVFTIPKETIKQLQEIQKFEFKSEWRVEEARKALEEEMDKVSPKEKELSPVDSWVEQWEKDNG